MGGEKIPVGTEADPSDKQSGRQSKRRASGEQTIFRQWLLLRAISARRYGATIRELAQEFRVSERTIRRDLQMFASLGMPLVETVGDFGRKTWRMESDGRTPTVSFAVDEALALYLGRRFLDPLAGTFLWEAAQQAFKKIRATLGKPALDYLEKNADGVHPTSIGASDYSHQGEQIDRLLQAIEDRRATFIAYRSLRATEPVTYDVHPYGLVYHRGSLYLVAFSRDHGELRHFKIDRLSSVDVTEFPFVRPDDFDLARHLDGSFGVFHAQGDVTVRVRFAPAVARFVQEGKWHASQKLTPTRDGGIEASFRLSSVEEILRWILSFGRNAEVLEPESLISEIAAEVAAMQSHYAASPRDGKPRRSGGRAKEPL